MHKLLDNQSKILKVKSNQENIVKVLWSLTLIRELPANNLAHFIILLKDS